MLDEVLLIDDDEITLMLCEMVMEHTKFARKVSKARNGRDAIDYYAALTGNEGKEITNRAPDLVFLDLNMPVMDGWEFLEAFEHQFGELLPETKVYILTSSVDPLDFSHSKIHRQVIGFLHKPFTAESITEIKENEHLAHLFQPN